MKKFISLFLSITMIISAMFCVDLSAYADELYEYESNNTWSTANKMNFGDTMYGRLYSDVHAGNADYNYPNRDCFVINSIEKDTLFKVRLTITGMCDKNTNNRYLFFGVGLSSNDNWEFSYSDNTETIVTSNTILARSGDTVQIRLAHVMGWSGYWCDYKIEVIPCVLTPSNLKVASRGANNLKMSWSKVSGATGYQLQQQTSSGWKTVANTTSTNYNVTGLSDSSIYTYRVRAYSNGSGNYAYSGWTNNLTACTKPKKVTLKSLETISKGHKIKVKWSKVTASGYQIYWAKDKNFKKVVAKKTISDKSKSSYTGKNFTKGKKYYVKVRAYKSLDGVKYYGEWSNVKTIKSK